MSVFHCSCGFAIDEADEFGDHLRAVFERPDDTGTDGRVHDEIDGTHQGLLCVCGFRADDPAEFDDHVLMALIPPDHVGNDGEKHFPVDPSTPDRWYIEGTPDE